MLSIPRRHVDSGAVREPRRFSSSCVEIGCKFLKVYHNDSGYQRKPSIKPNSNCNSNTQTTHVEGLCVPMCVGVIVLTSWSVSRVVGVRLSSSSHPDESIRTADDT